MHPSFRSWLRIFVQRFAVFHFILVVEEVLLTLSQRHYLLLPLLLPLLLLNTPPAPQAQAQVQVSVPW